MQAAIQPAAEYLASHAAAIKEEFNSMQTAIESASKSAGEYLASHADAMKEVADSQMLHAETFLNLCLTSAFEISNSAVTFTIMAAVSKTDLVNTMGNFQLLDTY